MTTWPISAPHRTVPLQCAVDDDSATGSRAHGQRHEVALVSSRTEAGFGPGHGVGVVLHHHGQPGPAHDLLAQRLVPPRQVRCEHDEGELRVHESRGRHSHGGDVVGPAQFLDGVHDGLEGLGCVAGGTGTTGGREHRSSIVDHARRDLRAADIDTDGERVGASARRAGSVGRSRGNVVSEMDIEPAWGPAGRRARRERPEPRPVTRDETSVE
jgi:hypothetical protein